MKDLKVTVRLSEKTYRDLKVKVAKTGMTIQEVLETAVNNYLRK